MDDDSGRRTTYHPISSPEDCGSTREQYFRYMVLVHADISFSKTEEVFCTGLLTANLIGDQERNFAKMKKENRIIF